MRTYVYIDGFNFYYRVVKGTPHKWLNFADLCRHLLPGHTVLRIKYFTAHVSARPGDPSQPVRQQIFLRALRTIPNLEIILGHFMQSEVSLPIVGSSPVRLARVIRTEEKGSDVNIAAHIVHDGHLGLYDAAVLISDDSDLEEPVRIVKNELRKVTGILTSKSRPSFALARYATFYKRIRSGVLAASQFPPRLKDAVGEFHKPTAW
ncbi:MAG: NYN domain-containing protein [Candidatus Acidiferrales bacterium]